MTKQRFTSARTDLKQVPAIFKIAITHEMDW